MSLRTIPLRAMAGVATLLAVAACADAPTMTSNPNASLVASSPVLDLSTGPAPAPGPVVDVAYATRSAAQKLDIHVPTTGVKPYPVLLWIHGGGWSQGDKRLAATSLQLQLLNYGFAVVSANYRLSGEAKFPAQIQDVKAALRWVRANAARFNLDPNRIGVGGLSAGGHLAALLGTSNGIASLTDLSLGNPTMSEAVKAVVAQAPPVNFLSLDSQLAVDGCPLYGGSGYASASSPVSQLMGKAIPLIPSQVLAASPRTYVSAGDAKFLIQHGQLDCTVPWQQGQNLHSRIQSVLGAAASQLDLFPTGKHGGSHFTDAANLSRIVKYLRATL